MLLGRLDNAAWLDADDVWRMHPVRTTDVDLAVRRLRQPMGLDTMKIDTIGRGPGEVAETVREIVESLGSANAPAAPTFGCQAPAVALSRQATAQAPGFRRYALACIIQLTRCSPDTNPL